MKVTERDKVAARTLIEVLNKAAYKLEGSEVLVVAQVMGWSGEMLSRIDEELNPKPLPQATPVVEPVQETPKEQKTSKRAKKEI